MSLRSVLKLRCFPLLGAGWALACSAGGDSGGFDGGAQAAGCPAGQVDCGAGCTDVNVDPAHCGGCNVACGASEVCTAGTCTCATGYTDCNGVCVDTMADPNNCGQCGVICSGQVCSQGVCSDSCGAGLTNCSGACVDVATDLLNCGTCGNACSGGETCVAGVCTAGGSGGMGGTSGGGGTTSGGTDPGSGGSDPGGGGADPGSGGSDPGSGGTDPGSGGEVTGSGGDGTGGAGGSTGGAGGATGGAATGGAATSSCDNADPPVLSNHPPPASDYTETAGGISLDFVYIPGGDIAVAGTASATVSSYHILKTEVTAAQMEALMGDEAPSGFGVGTWYDCMAFACALSRQTGRAYRMQTEAEWEYAATNHQSSLEQIGSGEEWTYNSWGDPMGGTDPVGAASGEHTQKTRKDTGSITGRLIRSIDGIGPNCRLTISNTTEFPPEYVPPCELCPPEIGDEPVNSYRDPRWITGDNAHWVAGAELGFGEMDLRVWEDGTAQQGSTAGQWFTSNNIVFVFVPDSGSNRVYPYIFLDETQGSLLSEGGFGAGGFIGRIAKEEESGSKPSVSNLQSGADLAAAAGDKFKMVDMENIPQADREQDSRLLDGTDQCWFQNNINVGGTHNYRKDIDPDEFRFVVIDGGNSIILANGDWFTVNDVFLRVTHPDGYVAEYLYAVSSDGGTFYHDSFMGYERADFRMFEKYGSTDGNFPATCINNSCSGEIPKGQGQSLYASQEDGGSTFVPAPTPEGGVY
jgi:hypothetical protein